MSPRWGLFLGLSFFYTPIEETPKQKPPLGKLDCYIIPFLKGYIALTAPKRTD